MIYINKQTEPERLSEFKRKNANATYDSQEFKPYISRLNKELVAEQNAYVPIVVAELMKIVLIMSI